MAVERKCRVPLIATQALVVSKQVGKKLAAIGVYCRLTLCFGHIFVLRVRYRMQRYDQQRTQLGDQKQHRHQPRTQRAGGYVYAAERKYMHRV